ncbi:hypothetical protein OHA70_29955 [Kribbella sp. NBC_00382]|uniref:hypothetical protein n=1 Tax=Kribbella sp. NBC_00382 TaxID=2975967 RepID=UPI002E21D9E9
MATAERVLSVVDATEGWDTELAELGARAEAAEYGLVADLELEVTFRGPSDLTCLRVEGFDEEGSTLAVVVTLPHGLVRERDQALLMLLQEALDAADTFAEESARAADLWAAWQVMVRLTSGGTPYERWMDAYMLAHHAPESLRTQPCPDCGAYQLHLEFEVRDPCADHGTAYFWCNACLKGPMPNTAPLPPNARTTPWGTLNPPNYKIIPES